MKNNEMNNKINELLIKLIKWMKKDLKQPIFYLEA